MPRAEEQGDRRLWALLAFFGFGLMVTVLQRQALVGLLIAIVGMGLLLFRPRSPYSLLSHSLAAGIPLLFGFLWLTAERTPFPGEPSWFHWLGGTLWILLAVPLAIRGHGLGKQACAAVVSFGLLVATGLGVVLLVSTRDYGIDVTFLHQSATDALLSGSSPYGDAVVVADGAPTAPPGSEIVGYLYPPATLFPFAAGTIVADPRLTSLISWLLTLGIVGRGSFRSVEPLLPLGAFLGLASLPGWPLTLVTSWTEPLTIAAFATALAVWSRTALSSIVLGFALATKQYLVVLAPILLVWQVDRRLQRLAITAVTTIVMLAPILYWDDLRSTLDALVTFHLQTAPRPDGTSLIGLISLFGWSVDLPSWLAVLVPVALAGAIGSQVTKHVDLAVAISGVLAVAFLLGSQAFANYWLLPAGLMALVVSISASASGATTPVQEVAETT